MLQNQNVSAWKKIGIIWYHTVQYIRYISKILEEIRNCTFPRILTVSSWSVIRSWSGGGTGTVHTVITIKNINDIRTISICHFFVKVAHTEWGGFFRNFCSWKHSCIRVYGFYTSNGLYFSTKNSTYEKYTRLIVQFLHFFYRKF